MKKCPFCAEQIQQEAIKCRFCGEFLDERHSPKLKWYFSTYIVVIALLCIGPVALPLVWFNPRYGITAKIVVTVIVIAISACFYLIMKELYIRLTKQLEELNCYAVFF